MSGWKSWEKAGVNLDLIEPREIDLTTLDGRANYGKLEVKAAPLTLDEARMYAKFIPKSNDWSWLATGWGAPGMNGSQGAFGVGSMAIGATAAARTRTVFAPLWSFPLLS